jgi:uncharacterized phage-like protein YoqJ
MIVTFCGHNDVPQSETVKEWLHNVISDLIERGADTFYLGGYGSFDSLAATVVKEQQRLHPAIESVLVIPYLNTNQNHDRYDRLLYPGLENVPPRFAISKRNQWMVNEADVVVAYVTHSWGGAKKTLDCARRKRKQIILFPDSMNSSAKPLSF